MEFGCHLPVFGPQTLQAYRDHGVGTVILDTRYRDLADLVGLYARLVRGSVLSIKEKEYIVACRALGVRDPWILLLHVLPNCLAPIIVTTTLGIATSIIVEATLSFLGLGTQPPTPSWGWDLKANIAYLQTTPWLALFPGLAIFVTVLGFNLFGDGLRDALDPRLK